MTTRLAPQIPSGDRGVALVQNIQALRGVAILLVLWVHLKFAIGPLNPAAAEKGVIETAFGGMGVDLFFVISGFVICLTACKKHHGALDFFLARVARVTPLYLLLSLLAFVVIPKTYVSWHLVSARAAWNQIFYLPLFDLHTYTILPLGIGWTLSFEMWFYLVFALLLNFWKPAQVTLILPAIFLVGCCLMTAFYRGAWFFPHFAFHPFVLEFALGCLVFHTQRFVNGRTAWALFLGGFVFMALFSRHSGRLGWHGQVLNFHLDLAWLRVFDWGVPSALFAAGLVGLERHRGVVLPRVLMALGTISYSLYLTHWFMIPVVVRFGQMIGLHNAFAIALLMPTVSILVGWLCWRFLERPMTLIAQGWARSVTRPKPAS
jgi:peptidoglycan/LPS O-acetylase OafA/YrhL